MVLDILFAVSLLILLVGVVIGVISALRPTRAAKLAFGLTVAVAGGIMIIPIIGRAAEDHPVLWAAAVLMALTLTWALSVVMHEFVQKRRST
jgi:uncharacterized membrane protein